MDQFTSETMQEAGGFAAPSPGHTRVRPTRADAGRRSGSSTRERRTEPAATTRDAQQPEQTVNARAVRSTVPKAGKYPDLPHESPCFRIDTFVLDVPTTLSGIECKNGASSLPLDLFWFPREWLDHYKGECIGKTGLAILTKGLQQTILSRGYVTTRVLLPEQDLSKGTLKEKVNMEIEPTDAPGERDVVISVKRSKSWTFIVSAHNPGTDATGKWHGNLNPGIDNPLSLNDVFMVGANQDLSFCSKTIGSQREQRF